MAKREIEEVEILEYAGKLFNCICMNEDLNGITTKQLYDLSVVCLSIQRKENNKKEHNISDTFAFLATTNDRTEEQKRVDEITLSHGNIPKPWPPY